ncbi:unnamed protein product [Effrenium voratum]|uniref:Ion transport domain-containing protein n=1 Tax=Effrenium voratum TaxID=2562239 RepID=A0AA36NID1_9DINO|nr:unnamed protein product [Effrenium voratum]
MAHVDGVAAKLHMQDLMNHNAGKAFVRQSKRVKQGISRFRTTIRGITGTPFFDFMIAVLVLVDMSCIILQQELYPQDDAIQQGELMLRTVSLAVTVTFVVEFTARCIGQIGLGFSWMLVMDGFIVIGSCVEVLWFYVDPKNSQVLRWLRPLRGLRIFRALRSTVRLLRRSAAADLAFHAFESSLKPLSVSLTVIAIATMAASVVLTLQVPGLMEELESPELKREILDEFGSIFDATASVMKVVAGSHQMGHLLMRIFAESGVERFQLSLFVGTAMAFLAVLSLSLSGVFCGVLLSQTIIQKGDAELDGGMQQFKRNQNLVQTLNQVWKDAGYENADTIDWKDILKVMTANEASASRDAREMAVLLASPKESSTESLEPGEKESEEDCLLKDQGITMEDFRAAYNEMCLFGPVCVEDFILCVFKHVTNVKTVPFLSFNHQQNKVYLRIQHHGRVVDEGLRDLQTKIGMLQQMLPPMIEDVQAAAADLQELEELEDRLEKRKQALRELIDTREKDHGFAEVPKDEMVQAQREQNELRDDLEDLELLAEKASGKRSLLPDEATSALNHLADEMADHLWHVILEEMQEAESPPASRDEEPPGEILRPRR